MCVAQSTLSHALRQLEEELDIVLFDRVGRTIRLTQAGRVFHDYAARTCNETMRAKRAMQELNELDAGTFTLGAIPVFPLSFLPGAVSSFNQRYPKVRIVVQDLLTAELEEKLALNLSAFLWARRLNNRLSTRLRESLAEQDSKLVHR